MSAPHELFPRRWLNFGGLITAFAILVAIGVVAGAIALLAHAHKPPATPTNETPSAAGGIRGIEKFAASQFAVFARPQTAKDRSLPGVVRRAVRLGGLGSGPGSVLAGAVPNLTRYTQTLPDGREVFLTVYNPAATAPRRAGPALNSVLVVGPVIVQPDGKWTNGQPLDTPRSGETAGDAYLTARAGRQACGLDTYNVIVPNQVARIRWQFGRQDAQGYVFSAPLTVDMTVHGNVAVATIPQRASCDRPAVVTLYGQHGQVLSQTGDTSNLNRITRPVNHGDPFGYKTLLQRPKGSARRR